MKVLITTPIESHLVERINTVDERLEVIYRMDLIAKARFPGDHTALVQRTPAQAEEWAQLMAEAEIFFDIERSTAVELPKRAPRLRWIQFTSSGIAPMVEKAGLRESHILVTNAAGVHSIPLSEYVLFAMLYFAKRMPRILAEQRAHHWERLAINTLPGKSLGVIGLGNVGRAVAQKARINDVHVLGMDRPMEGATAETFGVDELFSRGQLSTLLARSDYLVLTVPLLPDTAGMIGERELAAMKPGAVLINISRGPVVDEPALTRALQSGHLGGAALDVFVEEPLPAGSPLWDMPNVLVTPHSMSTAVEENERMVELFCDNLRRYLDGRPLRNEFNKARGF